MSAPGIENFGQVSPTLYRGAQPTPQGLRYLHSIGVLIDADARSPYPQAEQERTSCQLVGIKYVHLYWDADPFISVPNMQAVKDFVQLVRNNPGKKLFIHCKTGSDRTGVCCAVYRIVFEGWSPKAAAAEMSKYGYHWYLFPRWKGWVASRKASDFA